MSVDKITTEIKASGNDVISAINQSGNVKASFDKLDGTLAKALKLHGEKSFAGLSSHDNESELDHTRIIASGVMNNVLLAALGNKDNALIALQSKTYEHANSSDLLKNDLKLDYENLKKQSQQTKKSEQVADIGVFPSQARA